MEAYGDGEEADIEDGDGTAMPGTMASSASVSPLRHPAGRTAATFRLHLEIRHAVRNDGDRLDRHHAGSAVWALIVLVILSGLAALISMTRNGIRTFWGSIEGAVPRVLVVELTP